MSYLVFVPSSTYVPYEEFLKFLSLISFKYIKIGATICYCTILYTYMLYIRTLYILSVSFVFVASMQSNQ